MFFLWNGLINRTSILIAEELDVCPCWNRKILHLPWMTKDVWNMLTIWSAVSFILVVLFRSRTCDNALENHGRNEERTFFIFMSTEAVWSSWQERLHREKNNNGTCNVATSSNQATSSRIQHHPTHFTWRYYTPPPPPSVHNNGTCNVATSSNQATSSRIQLHPTHFTWRYSTPHPPFCKQQRNLQRSNIFQPSNIFQDSTSSNALHMTLLHPPHPSVNNNRTCNVATSSNQATSSRIQHHPTHFAWRYYTPPPPPPHPPHLYTRTTFLV